MPYERESHSAGPPGASAIFDTLLDLWNSGDLDQLSTLLEPDYRGHMLYQEPGERDGATYRAHIERYRGASPNVRFEVVDQFGGGDRLCTRLIGRRFDPASGEDQIVHGINISRYVNGLLAEEWAVWSAWRRSSGE